MINIKDLGQYLAQRSLIKGDDIKVITIINEKHTVLLEQKMEITNILFKQQLDYMVLYLNHSRVLHLSDYKPIFYLAKDRILPNKFQ